MSVSGEKIYDVAIIGGGLAGLTAALDLSLSGHSVVVFEKKSYPQHKVCGEYVSNEVLSYLSSIGIEISQIQAKRVCRFRLHNQNGEFVESDLPLGGFGLSRYCFDQHIAQKAISKGVQLLTHHTIQAVTLTNDIFSLSTNKKESFKAKVVIGSFGKKANLDRKLNRRFLQKKTSYIGVKYYIDSPSFADDLVALYNFHGGYGGAVKVENGLVDIAYLTTEESIKKAGSIEAFEHQFLFKNRAFKALIDQPKVADKIHTISNISFAPKATVVNHMLMIGDAAGMIPPLAGNGMAMAIHAAKIASQQTSNFLSGQIDRQEMEGTYAQVWNQEFGYRLFWGRTLQHFLKTPFWIDIAVSLFQKSPNLLKSIIRQTHGQPF